MSFVIILEYADKLQRRVVGPYRSFKRADGDARAWDGWGVKATVEPIENPEEAFVVTITEQDHG